jgi:hypothetical protein
MQSKSKSGKGRTQLVHRRSVDLPVTSSGKELQGREVSRCFDFRGHLGLKPHKGDQGCRLHVKGHASRPAFE